MKRQVVDYPAALIFQIQALSLPLPEREVQFHPVRKWRWDLAWRERMLAVEIDGGVWSGGRHVRGAGYAGDCEKVAEGQLLGWTVYRFPADWVTSGKALEYVRLALEAICTTR